MNLEQILELSNLAKTQGNETKLLRANFEQIEKHNDKTYLALLGPRGVGKTILLKQVHSKRDDSLYLSLDALEPDLDLFSLIKNLNHDFKFKTFLLDEVHFLNDINRHLKMLFDNLNIKVIFTSSVALKLIESAHDLSRRVKVLPITPFSFREYLKFKSVEAPKALSWDDLIQGRFSANHIALAPMLKNYLMGENYAFSLEVADILSALKANLEKIIRFDIPKLKSITTNEIFIIEKVFKFIARTKVSDISPSSIAQNLNITRYKACQYLELLEQAFIVRQVSAGGTNVLREPKVLLTAPYRLLEQTYEDAVGGLREDFAVSCLSNLGFEFSYLKSIRGEKTPDYLVAIGKNKFVIEIGGAGKSFSQFKGISKEYQRVVFSDGLEAGAGKLPLVLLGYVETI